MVEQLNAQDAQFLYLQNGNNYTHVMSVFIFDPSTSPNGEVRFKDILAHIENRLHVSPVFKRKLMMLPLNLDHPYWVEDDDFDLESHITHGRLPHPGDWRQFCIHIARHFSKTMDMSRPLWDMYVVEGLDNIPGIPQDSYALLSRVHHATIDGASAAHFYTALKDADNLGTPALAVAKNDIISYPNKPALMQILFNSWLNNVRSPVQMSRTLMQFAPIFVSNLTDQIIKRNKAEKKSGIPKTRFSAKVSRHRVFEAAVFDIQRLKEIKSGVEGASLNDVVITICTGAMRHYLLHHEEMPKDRLIAFVPINARSKDDKASTPGTNISAMSIPLPIDLEDPQDQLMAVIAQTKTAKAAKSGLSARVMTDLGRHIPGMTMAGVARLISNSGATPSLGNLTISNVPGPQTELFMNGAKNLHQFGLGPIADGMGLFINTPSYNGKIAFCITSDRKMMPDADFFRECIEFAVDQLEAAVTKDAIARE